MTGSLKTQRFLLLQDNLSIHCELCCTNNPIQRSNCARQGVKLQITRLTDESQVILDVIDDGPGIDADAESKLFEPFFTTDSGGTGLGLYIGRELCEANGAILEYQPAVGRGACFRIVFGVNNGF